MSQPGNWCFPHLWRRGYRLPHSYNPVGILYGYSKWWLHWNKRSRVSHDNLKAVWYFNSVLCELEGSAKCQYPHLIMYKVPFKVIFLSNQCGGDWKVDLSPPPSPSFSLNHTSSGFSCFIAGRFHLRFCLKRKGVLSLQLLDLFSRLYSS